MLIGVMTVPEPHPDTVHSSNLIVICEVEAAGVEYTPFAFTRSERLTRFKVPAGIVQAIMFWSVATLALTVTGVTFTQDQAPDGDISPLLLALKWRVWSVELSLSLT